MNNFSSTGTPGQGEVIREEGARLDRKFSVNFSYCDDVLSTDWLPTIPYGRKFRQLYSSFVKARSAFMNRVSAELGEPILLLDADGSISIFGEAQHD